jgi:tetratricopeptide (TPR) repeat protein
MTLRAALSVLAVLVLVAWPSSPTRAQGSAAARAPELAAKAAPTTDRDKAIADRELGDRLLAKGDLVGAAKAYEESLGIVRALAAADPSNPAAQRDLSVALETTSYTLQAQGDWAGAVQEAGESVDIRRHLAAADPSGAQAQLDLALSLLRSGDVLRGAGDTAASAKPYSEMLDVVRRLAAAEPTDAEVQRALFIALQRLAKIGAASVRWTDVVAQLESMDQRGVLAEGDRHYLNEARAIAAEAAAKGS